MFNCKSLKLHIFCKIIIKDIKLALHDKRKLFGNNLIIIFFGKVLIKHFIPFCIKNIINHISHLLNLMKRICR